MTAGNHRQVVERLIHVLSSPRVEAVSQRREASNGDHGEPVRLPIVGHTPNTELGRQVLAIASGGHGRIQAVEAHPRLINYVWRECMRVAQHGAAIIDYLRKKLISR